MIDIIQTIPPHLVAQHTAQSRLVVYPDDRTPCDPDLLTVLTGRIAAKAKEVLK